MEIDEYYDLSDKEELNKTMAPTASNIHSQVTALPTLTASSHMQQLTEINEDDQDEEGGTAVSTTENRAQNTESPELSSYQPELSTIEEISDEAVNTPATPPRKTTTSSASAPYQSYYQRRMAEIDENYDEDDNEEEVDAAIPTAPSNSPFVETMKIPA